MDILHIKELAVDTHIGVHTWEKHILQRLLLDISIANDISDCEDSLDKTIDYDKLCRQVTHYVASHTFQLIETVAEKVAVLIKQDFKVSQVTITVSKPHAIKNARTVQVTITR